MELPRILLVEDDKAYHVMVRDILEGEYEVTVATTVEEAREQIRRAAAGRAAFRAMVLDFHLNGGNARFDDETGDRVLAEARQELGKEFPIIGFSGRTMETHHVNGLYADITKDGWFELPDILDSILDSEAQQAV